MTKVVADGGDVHVQVPVDEGGGAVQVPEREDLTNDDEGDDDVPIPVDDSGGTVHVQTPVDGGGGTVQVQAVGGADVAKVDEDDPVQVQVDDEDEVAKVVGPDEGPKTEEETGDILMTKQNQFAHGGEGGITKSAAAALFFLVTNAGSFGLAASTKLIFPTELIVLYIV